MNDQIVRDLLAKGIDEVSAGQYLMGLLKLKAALRELNSPPPAANKTDSYLSVDEEPSESDDPLPVPFPEEESSSEEELSDEPEPTPPPPPEEESSESDSEDYWDESSDEESSEY